MSDHLTKSDVQEIVEALRNESVEKRLAARWVLGIAATILTLVLSAQAYNQSEMKRDLAVVKNEVSHINASIVEKMDDDFTGSDAKALSELLGMRFESIDRELEDLTARVAALELKDK